MTRTITEKKQEIEDTIPFERVMANNWFPILNNTIVLSSKRIHKKISNPNPKHFNVHLILNIISL